MLHLRNYILIVIPGLILFSCERIKRKGHDVVDKTKSQISEKRDAVAEKVLPNFDSYKADTKFNKKRFEEFFGFAPPEDVSEIFCFDDQIGIDSKFIFSFRCNSSTKDKIVAHLKLAQKNEPDNYSSGLWPDFPWWDSAKIVTLNPYSRKTANNYYYYLWFDTTKSKVYYIDFDM